MPSTKTTQTKTKPPKTTSKDPTKSKKNKTKAAPTPKKHRDILLFTAQINEPSYSAAFDVMVFDRQTDLVAGINKWHRDNGLYDSRADDDYLGLFVESAKLEERPDKRYGSVLVFGTMFLCKECMDVGLIAHESFHAATTFMRRCVRYEGQYGDRLDSGDDPEERMAYCVESYLEGVIRECSEHGIEVRLHPIDECDECEKKKEDTKCSTEK